MKSNIFKNWQSDLPAGLVVFLVALPLCLGIGLASTSVDGIEGLPNIFSGIISGIIGGLLVGVLSGSRLGVSGPAAGLITIILAAFVTLGSYQAFLVAVVISGVLQIVAGYAKAGIAANYVPTAVIRGMLAAIGITLILKQLPHLVAYDADFFGDDAFLQSDGHNTFTEIFYSFRAFQPGAVIIGAASLFILIAYEKFKLNNTKLFKFIPGALLVVLFGSLINILFQQYFPTLFLSVEHMVNLPVANSFNEFTSFFTFPDFSYLSNPNVYIIGFTIALVGSLETMLSVEATDKLDPKKKRTPTNRELKAQGVGNIFSGMIGGLPITQVIVRSSANISSKAESKLSAIFHGLLLFLSVVFIPGILNYIPLAALAAILLSIGYKLARIELFKTMYTLGYDQFIPFVATILGVLFTDLLRGILIGLFVAILFLLKKYLKIHFSMEQKKGVTKLTLSENVSFLNKAGMLETLRDLPNNSKLIIDGSSNKYIDQDVKEVIQEFKNFRAPDRNIEVELINLNIS
ncbi:SulP family inorganic anion transporter [Crocinitomicaceae bacterium]|nr:SulP family inorganic anion transporter [Crocinitomicaceae bacterium]